jgi:hypothetical protein
MSISVRTIREDDARFTVDVTVQKGGGETHHEVTLSRADLVRLARPGESAETFVERCFEFLLEREPKESILRAFDVSVIARYFPEFERTLRGQP